MINEREKLIGARLRAFREALQIPRSKFAVTIGFGSERLASYEAGLAPLLYNVFRAVAQNFNLNPQWLAGDGGSPQIGTSYNDASFIDQIPYRALFSEAYDLHLADRMKKNAADEDQKSKVFLAYLKTQLEKAKDQSIPIEERQKIRKMVSEQSKKYISSVTIEINKRGVFNLKLNEGNSKNNLTEDSLKSNNTDVKSEIQKLIERVNCKASRPGAKAELAKFLDVAPARISEWLSGKKEPGGNYTLRLLKWVEQA